jgi:hypothetical protein
MMASLFESGRIVELIVAAMALEALVFAALHLRGRLRVPVAGLLLNLAAGACLLLALRTVLVGADWRVAGAWLAAAGLAHLGDLGLRLRAD